MASQLETLLTSGNLTKKIYLFVCRLILFFFFSFFWWINVSALCCNPPSWGCKSVRFGAYNTEFFKTKITIIVVVAIIIKNWLPIPPRQGCLPDYEWLHFDFPSLPQMGLNRTRFPIIIAFCVKRSFPELSAAVLMGSLSICMLIVSSVLLGLSMEKPKSDASLFSRFTINLWLFVLTRSHLSLLCSKAS